MTEFWLETSEPRQAHLQPWQCSECGRSDTAMEDLTPDGRCQRCARATYMAKYRANHPAYRAALRNRIARRREVARQSAQRRYKPTGNPIGRPRKAVTA